MLIRNIIALVGILSLLDTCQGFGNARVLSRKSFITKSSTKDSSFTSMDPSILFKNELNKDITQSTNDKQFDINLLSLAVPVIASLVAFEPSVANAAASDYGILAGRTASLMHPFTNFALFFTSLYSGYLGLQWRRQRDIGEQLKALNAKMPKLSTGPAKSPISELIKNINAEIKTLEAEKDSATAKIDALKADLKLLNGASEVDAQIQELSSTRKQLVSMNLRDKHYLTGSILLGVGVTVSVLGAFNTYMRAGKLFPGPHLYAGMGITICWAVAAALVPSMQKGNEAARTAHIALNVINVALFAWQIPTGVEIMLKVIEKTQWP